MTEKKVIHIIAEKDEFDSDTFFEYFLLFIGTTLGLSFLFGFSSATLINIIIDLNATQLWTLAYSFSIFYMLIFEIYIGFSLTTKKEYIKHEIVEKVK